MDTIKRLPLPAILLFATAWSLDVVQPLAVFQPVAVANIEKYAVSLAIMAAALALFCRGSRATALARLSVPMLVLGAAGVIAALMQPVLPPSDLRVVLAAMASLALLVFRIYFIAFAFGALCRLALDDALFSLALWQVACTAWAVAYGLLPNEWMNAIAVLVVALAVLSWGRTPVESCPDSGGEPRPTAGIRGLVRQTPLKLIALYALVMMALHAVEGITELGPYPHLGSILAAGFIFVQLKLSRPLSGLKPLYHACLIGAEIALFLMVVSAPWAAVVSLVMVDGTTALFTAFLLVVLANLCMRHSLSPFAMIIVALMGSTLGSLAGVLVSLLRDSLPITGSELFFALALAVTFAFTFFSTERDYQNSWGTNRDESYRMSMIDYYATLPGRCSIVATKYGLSRREEDVLLLLAQAKTTPEVAQELVIGLATVKTHVRNIYKKMSVHSRSEFLELVGYPDYEGASEA